MTQDTIISFSDFATAKAAMVAAEVVSVYVKGRRFRRKTNEDPNILQCYFDSQDGQSWYLDERVFDSQDARNLGIDDDEISNKELDIRRVISAAFLLGKLYNHTAGTMYAINGAVAQSTVLDYDVGNFDEKAGAFSTAEDLDTYNKFVVPSMESTPSDLTNFNVYKDDIERFNGLARALDWYSKCPGSKSNWSVRIPNGGFKIFGHKQFRGPDTKVKLKGSTVQTLTIASVAFASSDHLVHSGADFSKVTITLTTPLNAAAIDGMAFGIECADQTVGASDAAKLNGAALIDSIVDDTTITATIWNKDGDQALVSPTAIAPGSKIVLPLSQLFDTGGYDDRGQEALFWFAEGARFEEDFIGHADHVDATIVDHYDPTNPDRKGLLLTESATYEANSVVYCGFEGRVLRAAIFSDARLSSFYGGSVGKTSKCERGIDLQIHSEAFCSNSWFGGFEEQAALAGGYSELSYQNSGVANSAFGLSTVTGGRVNAQSADIKHCSKPVFVGRACTAFVDASTNIESSGPMDWRALGYVVNVNTSPSFVDGTGADAVAPIDTLFRGGAWIGSDANL